MEVGILWSAHSALDAPGVQSPGRAVLRKGPRATAMRTGGPALPAFLVSEDQSAWPGQTREQALSPGLLSSQHP